MRKTNKRKPLTLSAEKLRELQSETLVEIVGGKPHCNASSYACIDTVCCQIGG